MRSSVRKAWYGVVALLFLSASAIFANDYYTHGNFPSPSSPATSASMRAELDLISSGFAKLPTLTGNGGKVVIVNGGATGLTTTTGQLSLAGNFSITGAFDTTLVQSASTTLTLPAVSGTLATLNGFETFTNKSISGNQITSAVANATSAVLANTVTTNANLSGPITSVGNSTAVASQTGTGSTFVMQTGPTISTPTISGGTHTGIVTGTVSADPVTALGIASKQYADAVGFTTGDVKLTLKTVADTGFVLMDDKSIGDASSSATGRANADTASLYTLMWTNCANAQCAVSSGRGGSAAADFAAHKTIALPKALGRALATYGSGASLTARVMGQTLGEESHVQTLAELAAHTHTTPQEDTTTPGGGFAASSGHLSSQASGSAGSSTAFNVMQPTLFLNVMIRL